MTEPERLWSSSSKAASDVPEIPQKRLFRRASKDTQIHKSAYFEDSRTALVGVTNARCSTVLANAAATLPLATGCGCRSPISVVVVRRSGRACGIAVEARH